MAAYQQAAKRQKVREGRDADCFQGIDKIEYSNMAGAGDATRYRFYSASERVHNKTMEEWLKFSVSLTEFRSNGSELHGRATHPRPWDDHTDSLENHKRCIKALYEFCAKLGVKYWTAFDTDLVPAAESWDECRTNWDEIVAYVGELNQRYHLKLLWIAPDLHSHPRYASGAFTSPDASVFAQAAAQVKRGLEASHRLGAECFLLYPRGEGYHSIIHTDVAKEIKLFSKLLKITAEYKDRLSYRCQLLMMPSPQRPGVGASPARPGVGASPLGRAYLRDATSCLHLLRSHSLERHYRVCSPPGHHMYMATVYNMLGGVTISNDIDHCDSKTLTLMMKCIVDQGTAPPGGINLQLVPCSNTDHRDFVTAYVKYIDAIAKGLRLACNVLSQQMFSNHLQQRYASYRSGFGSRLVSGDVSLEECEEYHKKNQPAPGEPAASKCEHLELAFQRCLDTSEHV